MAKIQIILEGEDKEELVAAMQEWLKHFGAEASEESETEEDTSDDTEEDTSDGANGETDDSGLVDDEDTEIRSKLQAHIRANMKKPVFVDKTKSLFKKYKAGKLSDIDDKDLKAVAKAMGVKV